MNIEKIIRTINGQVFTLIPVTTVLQTEVPVVTSSEVSTASNKNSFSSVAATYISSISTTTAKSSTSLTPTTTSHSFNLGTTANSGSVGETSSISSKTGLIVGLSVGIPVFLFVILTILWYYKFKNKKMVSKNNYTFKTSKWETNSNDDDFMMTKNFKVIKNVITPVRAKTKDDIYLYDQSSNNKLILRSDNKRGIDNWRAHIFTPFRNSFIAESKTDKHSGFNIDLEKNASLKNLETEDELSEKSKNISKSSNDDFDAEKFLYTNPPKIKNITSELSSFKSIENKKSKKCKDLNLDNIVDTQSLHEKWAYNSPLSKWFLRESTYLQESQMTTPTDQILSVDLKTLQLPSKEKTITKRSSKVNLKIRRKHIIDINKMKRLSTIMYIREKPLPKPPSSVLGEKRLSRLSVLTGSFQKASSETKKSKYITIKAYSPQMLDELELVKGQMVKIISIHSDGWALVTLSNRDTLDSGDLEHAGENGCTGVVPLICLQKL